jgi:hypothetical protein
MLVKVSQSTTRFQLAPTWSTKPSFSVSDFPQVAEGRCRCGGSNKAISVERDSLRREQLLEPLALIERRLDPKIRI